MPPSKTAVRSRLRAVAGAWACGVVALVLTSCAAFGETSVATNAADGPAVLAGAPAAPVAPTAVVTTAPIPFPTQEPTATSTPVPPPAATRAATTAPQPAPTAAPLPAATAQATSTPEPAPTATAAPAPTSTPLPTSTPQPLPTATPTTAPTPAPTTVPAGDQGFARPAGSGLDRSIARVGYVLLGDAGGVPVRLPAARMELIGYHEAGHPGAQGINVADSGLPTMVLETRSRGTDARSAADIVVPPDEPIRAPVSGTVIASKSYVLYCEYEDKLVYIEPDGLPGWQVRIFHVTGATPAVGSRVVAGETQIADGAFTLPFESQVDKFTAEPSWPHVHVEVVDTSIVDDRPKGPGCP